MGTKITISDTAREALYTKVNAIADEKQDSLTTSQLNAVNSGITSTLVTEFNAKGSNLDYTGTTLSLKDSSGNNLSQVTIKSTPDLDNSTISLNSSDELQSIAVKNQNTSGVVKTWTGTMSQYDSIQTKDQDTIYYITDDTDITLSVLEALYPVGSIYIGTQSTCPLSTLISGSTWTLVSSGRVLQGSDSNHNAGTTIEAGLPNITGDIFTGGNYGSDIFTSSIGAFQNGSNIGWRTSTVQSTVSGASDTITFDASRSSSIYGNSNTVQPPAYVVNIWRRTA